MILLEEEPDAYIRALPAYQQDTIAEMFKAGLSGDQIADELINGSAARSISPHGTLKSNVNFSLALKVELRLLICTDDKKYKDLRDSFSKQGGKISNVSCSAIAVALAPYVGVAAVALGPAVAVLIQSAARIGKNAWCQS